MCITFAIIHSYRSHSLLSFHVPSLPAFEGNALGLYVAHLTPAYLELKKCEAGATIVARRGYKMKNECIRFEIKKIPYERYVN